MQEGTTNGRRDTSATNDTPMDLASVPLGDLVLEVHRRGATAELRELTGVTLDEAGLHLTRLDWMTDQQWRYVVDEMTAWWEAYWPKLVGGDVR